MRVCVVCVLMFFVNEDALLAESDDDMQRLLYKFYVEAKKVQHGNINRKT